MTTETIAFFVSGLPAPAGSKRGFHIPSLNRVVITDACKRTKPWQHAIKAAALDAYRGPILEGPVKLEIEFCMPRPKGHFGSGKNAGVVKASAPAWHTQKPDALKLTRAVEDALTGIVWRDDSQIVQEIISKKWTTGMPGVLVTVIKIEPRSET